LNTRGQGGTWDLRFTEADFHHCIDPTHTPSWMEWQNCIEMSAGTCFQPGTKEHEIRTRVLPALMREGIEGQQEPVLLRTILAQLADKLPPNCSDTMLDGYFRLSGNTSIPRNMEGRGYANYLHSQVHSKLGLDFLDVSTSPNDAVVFTSYHADIDRSNLHWMHAARHQLEYVNWAYPSSQSVEAAEQISGPKPYGFSGPFSLFAKKKCGTAREFTGETPWLPGTLLGDVVNSGFPFYNLFEGHNGGVHGYTHGHVLSLTAPSRTPYTYDTLEHLYY